jgi:transposase-like protein
MIIVAIRWYLRYLRRVIDELLPAACHVTKQYANNAVEATFRPR